MSKPGFPDGPIGSLIADQVGGGTPSRQNPVYWNGPIPWASVKDFEDGQLELASTEETISRQGLNNSATNLIPANTPIVCTRMAVGRAAVAPMDAAINQDLKALFPARDVSTRYLLRLADFAKPLAEAVSVGSTVKGIKIADYLNINVPLAPSTQQSKIAEVLDTLDAAIRGTEAVVAKLKAMKQGLLHDLLTHGIDANGDLRPPHTEAPHLYKETPLGWLPKEWDETTLGEIAEVDRGQFTHRPRNDPAYYGGSFPFIQTGDVAAAKGDFVTQSSQTLNAKGARVSREFPAGTIAITIAANIADTGILAVPMYFPDSVVGAVVKEGINIRFVELWVRRAKRLLDARAPQSAQKNINLQDLRPLEVFLPGKDEQDGIGLRYDALFAKLNNEQRLLTKLRAQKSGLMDDLLTGRVPVTPLLEGEAAHGA